MNIINKKKYKTDVSRGGRIKNGAANNSHLHQTTPSSKHEGSPDNGSSSSGTASTSSLTLCSINDNNNSNNNNLSPSSINNNSTTPNTPDDEETINHIENECLKLTFEMNKIRKYTQEWFILETKLNNATEELDAAREDRDLHFGVSSSEQQLMAEDNLLPVSSVVTPEEEGEDNIGGVCEEVKPSAIPNTLLLPNDAFTVGGEESPSSSLIHPVASEQDGSFDCNDMNVQSNTNGNIAASLRLDRQRIESEMASLCKFSPQWFQLKEELFDVCIALEDAEEEGEIDKPTYEIAIVQTNSTINSRGAHQGLPPISPSSPSKQHRRFPSSPPLSPITRGSFSQVSSPNGRGSHLSSPYQSVTSNSQGHSRSSSFSSFNNNNPSTIYCHFFNDEEDCGEQQDIKRLEGEHALTEERLNTLPQFCKEWFDLKTRLVGLSDQIDKKKRQVELRDCSFSSSSDSQTLRNQSGWSSTWSDSESEVMSFASDLELCMVGEALGQYTKYDDVLDEDEELLLDWENSKTEKQDHKESAAAIKIQSLFRGKLVHRQYMQACEKSIIIQTCYRSRLARSKSIVCIQSIWRKSSHAKKATLLLDDCELVIRKLSCLLSVVKIQRAWRMYCEQVEVANLLHNCEKVMLQLEKLEAVTVIQSCTRRWLIKSRQIVVSLYKDPHAFDDESPAIDTSSLNFGTLRSNLENAVNEGAPTTPVISKEVGGDIKTPNFEEASPEFNSTPSQDIPKFSAEALRLAKQSIEYEISLHEKYSARWFHWKEELVELNLVLDEAEAHIE